MGNEQQQRGLATILAGIIGMGLGFSLFICAIVVTLSSLKPPVRFYQEMLVLATLISGVSLYVLIGYKHIRRNWRVACCSALGMFALVAAWTGYQ